MDRTTDVVDMLGGCLAEVVQLKHLSPPLGLIPRLADVSPDRPGKDLANALFLGVWEGENCLAPMPKSTWALEQLSAFIGLETNPSLVGGDEIVPIVGGFVHVLLVKTYGGKVGLIQLILVYDAHTPTTVLPIVRLIDRSSSWTVDIPL